jgi:hypothetical protein
MTELDPAADVAKILAKYKEELAKEVQDNKTLDLDHQKAGVRAEVYREIFREVEQICKVFALEEKVFADMVLEAAEHSKINYKKAEAAIKLLRKKFDPGQANQVVNAHATIVETFNAIEENLLERKKHQGMRGSFANTKDVAAAIGQPLCDKISEMYVTYRRPSVDATPAIRKARTTVMGCRDRVAVFLTELELLGKGASGGATDTDVSNTVGKIHAQIRSVRDEVVNGIGKTPSLVSTVNSIEAVTGYCLEAVPEFLAKKKSKDEKDRKVYVRDLEEKKKSVAAKHEALPPLEAYVESMEQKSETAAEQYASVVLVAKRAPNAKDVRANMNEMKAWVKEVQAGATKARKALEKAAKEVPKAQKLFLKETKA